MIADEIKSALSMPDVARFYGYEPNRADFIGCPFHNERTGSMKLYPNRFKCFGCGRTGDVIDFVSGVLNLSYRDALARLNADFRLGIDLSAPVDTALLRAHRAAQAEKKRRQELFDAEYRARCDEYRRLRWVRLNEKPTSWDDMSAEFLEGLGKLDALEWWLHENLGRRG